MAAIFSDQHRNRKKYHAELALKMNEVLSSVGRKPEIAKLVRKHPKMKADTLFWKHCRKYESESKTKSQGPDRTNSDELSSDLIKFR